MDFTLEAYKTLLNTLKNQGFSFLTISKFISNPSERIIALRHDVDRLPLNSLEFAGIKAKSGIRGTYYFRAMTESWDEEIIRKIAKMGHEVGYHYEDLTSVAERQKIKVKRQKYQGLEFREKSKKYIAGSKEYEKFERELVDIAIGSFAKNLEKLRKIAPVNTICMHGSPVSRWDNRLLWKYYNYHDFGIIGEPYFDIDFDEVLYLTDTGRRWNGESVSMRDKAEGSHLRSSSFGGQGRLKAEGENPYKDWKVKPVKFRVKGKDTFSPSRPLPLSPSSYKFHATSDIIKAAEEGKLPDKIMMTFHPQRWTDKPIPWVKELVWQNVKNVGKYFLVKIRD